MDAGWPGCLGRPLAGRWPPGIVATQGTSQLCALLWLAICAWLLAFLVLLVVSYLVQCLHLNLSCLDLLPGPLSMFVVGYASNPLNIDDPSAAVG